MTHPAHLYFGRPPAAAIAPEQVKKIHALKSRLRLTDEQYRWCLSEYWVTTSKDLSARQAAHLLARLEREALEQGVWSNYQARGKLRYEDMGQREGMASPRQLRMLEAMWKTVSRCRLPHERQKAFRRFLFRMVGVEDPRFLEAGQVQKIVTALEAMRASAR